MKSGPQDTTTKIYSLLSVWHLCMHINGKRTGKNTPQIDGNGFLKKGFGRQRETFTLNASVFKIFAKRIFAAHFCNSKKKEMNCYIAHLFLFINSMSFVFIQSNSSYNFKFKFLKKSFKNLK